MKQDLLDRFLRYVRVYTPSNENSGTSPSTQYQFDLAYMLEKEMKHMGIYDVYVDENCYVYGSIPASEGCESMPSIGFIAHMDTVSECCDKPVIPLVHENYNGDNGEGCDVKNSDKFYHWGGLLSLIALLEASH